MLIFICLQGKNRVQDSAVTDERVWGRTALPDNLNVKTRPPLTLYFDITALRLSRLLFFVHLSQCFLVILGFSMDIHIRKHYHFSTFFSPFGGQCAPFS